MPTYLSPGVYVEEVDCGSRPIEGVGTAVAAFVGLAEEGPFNTPTLVTNWTQFTSGTSAASSTGSYLAQSVYGYFQNGGGNCYVVRIGQDGSGNGGAAAAPRRSPPRPQAHARPATGSVALDAGAAGRARDRASTSTASRARRRRRHVQAGRQARRAGGRGVRPADHRPRQGQRRHRGQRRVQADHASRRPRTGAASRRRPRATASRCMPPPPPAAAPSPRLTADDYVGDVAERTGFSGLEAVDEITMVCVPDLMSAYQQGAIDLETVKAVQLAMIAHCELMGDRVAILDPPPGPERPADQGVAGRQGRLRLEVRRPLLAVDQGRRPGHRHEHRTCRRSGHMAGIWGRNDDTRGVHKAPANEVVRGAIDARDPDHQERARPAQPGRHQLHPGLPRPRASGSGARARCPPTRPGAT